VRVTLGIHFLLKLVLRKLFKIVMISISCIFPMRMKPAQTIVSVCRTPRSVLVPGKQTTQIAAKWFQHMTTQVLLEVLTAIHDHITLGRLTCSVNVRNHQYLNFQAIVIYKVFLTGAILRLIITRVKGNAWLQTNALHFLMVGESTTHSRVISFVSPPKQGTP